jgi:uncharacterized protein (DUF885 family)
VTDRTRATHTPAVASARDVADEYLARRADLDPVFAVALGLPNDPTALTDYSPAGVEERLASDRQTLVSLDSASHDTDADRVCATVLEKLLHVELALHDAGESWRELAPFESPAPNLRLCFDLMPRVTDEDWEAVAARMEELPVALAGVRESLELGVDQGRPGPSRQALVLSSMCREWGDSYFATMIGGYAGGRDSLAARLEAGARTAQHAYLDFAEYLRERYAPRASSQNGVGADRYALWARHHNGLDLDLMSTYEWGWHDLRHIQDRMREVAARIRPDASVDEVIEMLKTDPSRSIEAGEPFLRWLQDLVDATIAALDGVHFEIAEPLRRLECRFAPPGGAAAMYYTDPSEDFSRPGRVWYPLTGQSRLPLWSEVSVAYHEGVPGHHMQIGHSRVAPDLSRFQRFLFIPGHGEGWALYAELLMGELGFLEEPEHELGMLAMQGFRAARVVVDIGLHLGLAIPQDASFHPGERWTPDLAGEFIGGITGLHGGVVASEVERYLAMPGQAISYKVGEREWLSIREEVRRAQGSRFDLKEFHMRALDLGAMPMGLLRAELLRRPSHEAS